MLPGTTQLPNLIPTQYFGTSLAAAPLLSIIAAVLMFAMGYAYMIYAEKKVRKSGEGWTAPPGFEESKLTIQDKSQIPKPVFAFLPIVVVVLAILGFTIGFSAAGRSIDSAMLTTCVMISASILCIALNWKYFKGKKIKGIIGGGSNNAITALAGLAAVVSFGTVVSNAAAFKSVVEWVLQAPMSVYFKAVFSTGVISGVTGAATGGVQILLDNMAGYFIESGASLETLHRLISIASGTLDTLPHVAAIFLVFAVVRLSHKEAYKHVFFISVIHPTILAVVLAAAATIFQF